MRSSLVVEPMEVLYEMVPYDDRLPSAAAGEEAPQSGDEQTGAGGALAKLRGNLGAEAPTSGVLGGLTKAVMSDGDLQRAIVGQGSVSLPDVGTWGVQPGGDTSPLWSDEAKGLGFRQVLLPLSRQQLLATRYLKRVRSATIWDAATQQLSTQRPFEGAIRIGCGRKLKSADMFDGVRKRKLRPLFCMLPLTSAAPRSLTLIARCFGTGSASGQRECKLCPDFSADARLVAA